MLTGKRFNLTMDLEYVDVPSIFSKIKKYRNGVTDDKSVMFSHNRHQMTAKSQSFTLPSNNLGDYIFFKFL